MGLARAAVMPIAFRHPFSWSPAAHGGLRSWSHVRVRAVHPLEMGARVALWLSAWAVLSAGCSESSEPDKAKRSESPDQNLLPEELDGVFHLTGETGDLNPTNLRLASDGTFAWGVSGCDYFSGDVGTWSREGDEIVLHPSEGRERFLWSGRYGTAPVDEIVIKANETGLRAWSPSETSIEQQWDPNAVCPDCSGASSIACDDPYLADKPSL
jgi:hypothetical protein